MTQGFRMPKATVKSKENARRKMILGHAAKKSAKAPVTLARLSIEQDTLDGVSKARIEDRDG